MVHYPKQPKQEANWGAADKSTTLQKCPNSSRRGSRQTRPCRKTQGQLLVPILAVASMYEKSPALSQGASLGAMSVSCRALVTAWCWLHQVSWRNMMGRPSAQYSRKPRRYSAREAITPPSHTAAFRQSTSCILTPCSISVRTMLSFQYLGSRERFLFNHPAAWTGLAAPAVGTTTWYIPVSHSDNKSCRSQVAWSHLALPVVLLLHFYAERCTWCVQTLRTRPLSALLAHYRGASFVQFSPVQKAVYVIDHTCLRTCQVYDGSLFRNVQYWWLWRGLLTAARVDGKQIMQMWVCVFRLTGFLRNGASPV